MSDHHRIPTPDSDGDQLPSFTDDEVRQLCEAVATSTSAALGGMLCEATFFPDHAAFLVRLAKDAHPEVYH